MSESEPTFPPCPSKGTITIKGETFQCDAMRHMAPGSEDHSGWAHMSGAAEAIWQ